MVVVPFSHEQQSVRNRDEAAEHRRIQSPEEAGYGDAHKDERRWLGQVRDVGNKLLHDRTSERLADQLTRLPNVNVTYVPFRLGHHATNVATAAASDADPASVVPPTHDGIAGVEWRRAAHVVGTIEQLAIQTTSGTPSLIAVVSDGTGTIDLLFLGRTSIGGIVLGARLSADGTAISHHGRMTIMNPRYELLAPAPIH